MRRHAAPWRVRHGALQLGQAANTDCRAGRQRGRMGVWRHAHGGERKRAPRRGKTNRRECQLRAELVGVTACDAVGLVVSRFLLSVVWLVVDEEHPGFFSSGLSFRAWLLSRLPFCKSSADRLFFWRLLIAQRRHPCFFASRSLFWLSLHLPICVSLAFASAIGAQDGSVEANQAEALNQVQVDECR